MKYEDFLRAKVASAAQQGVPAVAEDFHPSLKPHQRDIAMWMAQGGRRACFAAFGLGKTRIQIEAVRVTLKYVGGRGLITLPLGVRQEFKLDAEALGVEVRFIRRIEEADATGIYLANYETVRDGKLDPRLFDVASLDEAAVLRGFGGTKTFREFMRLFAGDEGGTVPQARGVPYRFVATATPSPNEYIELLAYAAYLGVMDVGGAKTRFFKRDSTKADKLTIHPHKVEEFWLWVASWAIFVERPSDLGYSDEGYSLPEMHVRWHEVPTDHSRAGRDKGGQGRIFHDAVLGVSEAAREKRGSLGARIAKLQELRAAEPDEHRVIWHDLEDERRAIEAAVPDVASVYGAQDLDEREAIILAFADGKLRELAAKPVMLGSGCNLQRHCARAVFLGIGFKFNDFIQAIHRIQRFLQQRRVVIDLIYTEAEREVRRVLERKWAAHNAMVRRMTEIIKDHGLTHASIAGGLQRSMGVERVEVEGEDWKLVNADSITEARTMPDNSADLIITSIPFSTQYEYSPNFADLGHTDDDEHFFQHLGYLTQELLRVLKPGRIAAVHVKDRVIPGGLTGLGFQVIGYGARRPFSNQTENHFIEHGFAAMARITVVTDVVRENNQTYRLGWTRQCEDGTRMGNGMPEYVLLFRKPPTDSSDGFADNRVVKSKARYSRSRWQVDAHGFWRSNGNRPLCAEDLAGLPHADIFKLFRAWSSAAVYDVDLHAKLGEALERCHGCGHIHAGDKRCHECECARSGGRLPVTFMLLQPASHHADVWTDVARMRTLNMLQERKGQEMHLCPLQFDIVDRLIERFSMPGELVLDPFAGLGTVPYCAVKAGRRGLGVELSARYFGDAVSYLRDVEGARAMPTLFDLTGDKPGHAPAEDGAFAAEVAAETKG